jgi:hypothetical protein
MIFVGELDSVRQLKHETQLSLFQAAEKQVLPAGHAAIVKPLLIRQEKSDILSHSFPRKTRKWIGHPHPI